MTRPTPLLLLVLLLSGGACQSKEKKAPVQLGVPVGVHLAPADGVPAFDLGLAVDDGVQIDPLIPVLSGAMHQAVAACPAVLGEVAQHESTRLALTVEQGKVSSVDVFGAQPDPCLRDKLTGWTLSQQGVPPELKHVLVEIRAPSKAP